MESYLISLASNASPDTTLAAWEVGYRGPLTLALAIVLAAVLGVCAFVLYAVERRRLGIVRSIVLSLLRTLVLAVVLYLLMGPILLTELEDKRPRGIVLLVDNSLSMKQQDRRMLNADKARVAIAQGLLPLTTKLHTGAVVLLPKKTPPDPPRIELVRAVLEHPELKLSEKISKVGPIRPFLFGSRLHGPKAMDKDNDPVKRITASLSADEATTSLGDAIHEIITRKDGDLPAAIIVATDGLDNASKFHINEVADKCKDLGVPLHIYGVGAVEGGTLQLREAGIPDTIFYDDAIQIPVRWRAQGFKEGTVEIVLTLNGEKIASKERTLQLGEDLRDVLTFTPDKSWKDKGENLEFKASIRLKQPNEPKGAKKIEDALAAKQVRLIDSKIKVLYIEGSPRFEFKFLQQALMRDRRIDIDFLLTNADPRVLNSGKPYISNFPLTREKFFDAKYNLIILGDVASTFFTKEQMELLQEFVKNRGGLIVMGGRQHMPGSYVKTPLEEVIPFEFKPGRPVLREQERTQEYKPTLTSIGERTDWLALADKAEESRKLWESLPGFHWNYPPSDPMKAETGGGLIKMRPGASALVVNPRVKLGDEPMPIITLGNYGKGQVLFFSTDETWRWRYDVADKHYSRFWGQVIYQMGLSHLLGDNAQRVQMALERSEAVLGQPGSIYVRLLDKDFNPRKDSEVKAELYSLDGKDKKKRDITLRRIEGVGREGEYWAQLAHNDPGRFEIKLKNEGKTGSEEESSFTYRVTPPRGHELEETGMAEPLLRHVALASGGHFYREEDLYRLTDNLKPLKVSYFWREEIDLFPLLMALFVALITMEWLVRKFSDLS